MRRPQVLEFSSKQIILRTGPRKRDLVARELISPVVKPLVKWAGGKQWLAPAAPYLAPRGFTGHYFEPFLGGGAFFFALEPASGTLSDRNEELIATYDAVRNDTEGVIRLLKTYPYDKEFYYALRARAPHSPRTAAARFLYLNRACWNGLYRVNRDGQFNTPFGSFKNPTICDSERLREAARMLRRVALSVGDFANIVRKAKCGDFVYFDPPYITGHQHNGFLKYNAPLFRWADQERLAKVALELAKVGAFVLVSNANQPQVAKLYTSFNHYLITRRSMIGGSVSSRGDVVESLFSSYALLNEVR